MTEIYDIKMFTSLYLSGRIWIFFSPFYLFIFPTINIYSFYINETLWTRSCPPLAPYFPIPDLPPYIHSQSRKGQQSVPWFPIVVINLYRDPSLLIPLQIYICPQAPKSEKKSRPILKEIIWWAITNLIKIEGNRESEHYRLNPVINFISLFPPLRKGFWIRLHQTLLKTVEVFKIY